MIWMGAFEQKPGDEMLVTAKIRYSHQGAPCKVKMLDDNLVECSFLEPVRAITPGQAVVFYDDEYVLGGATIITDQNPSPCPL